MRSATTKWTVPDKLTIKNINTTPFPEDNTVKGLEFVILSKTRLKDAHHGFLFQFGERQAGEW